MSGITFRREIQAIQCEACGDEGGPHGLIGRLLLCEQCMDTAVTLAALMERPDAAAEYVRVMLQAAVTLRTRK